MSYADDMKIAEAPSLTIAERMERGRELGRHYDGAIIPVPQNFRERGIISAMDHGERSMVERHLAAGYRRTFFEYRYEAGAVVQNMLRLDHPIADKDVRPIHYCGRLKDKGNLF